MEARASGRTSRQSRRLFAPWFIFDVGLMKMRAVLVLSVAIMAGLTSATAQDLEDRYYVVLESFSGPNGSAAQGRPMGALPPYPIVMLQAHLAGQVLLRVTAGPDGKVKDAVVIKSTRKEFELPTVQAAGKWIVHRYEQDSSSAPAVVLDCLVTFAFATGDSDQKAK